MAENITSSTQEPTKEPFSEYAFLAGGGEMGERTRTYDWLNSPMGEPGTWPTSLRTLLHMMLTSRFPMLIFWGAELTTFYNDAFRPSLGNDGKHPSSLGQPGEQSWAESWSTIGPMIDSIMKGGEAVWFEDQKLPLFRDGQMGYAYWTYSFSPVINDTGAVNGILVTCSETTRAVESVEQLKATNQGLQELLEQNSVLRQEEQAAQEQLRDSQRQLLRSFEQVPVGIAILSVDQLMFRNANPFYGQLVGRSPGQLVGKPLLEALPELAGQGFDGLLQEVIATGKPIIAREVAVDIVRENGLETIYVDLTYQPQWETNEEMSSILVVATNVTQQVQSRRAVEESEAQLRSVVESAPFPIGVYIGPQMRIQLANQSIIDVFGKGNDVIGKSYKEVLPELNNQQIFEQMTGVLTTGIPYHARYQRVDIVVDGRLQPYYFNYSFTPLFNAEGQVYGVMNTAAEVTDLVIARQKVEESETRYRHLSRDLDLQVQQRTEELAATNEELMATNEELASVNEELATSNEELIESNDLLI
jgi:PAS domain S-box-containing protein